MAKNKNTQKPIEQEPQVEEEVIEGQDPAVTEDQPDATAEAATPDDAVTSDEDAIGEPSAETPNEEAAPKHAVEMTVHIDSSEAVQAVRDYVATLGNLHDRLTKAVRSLAPDAGQEKAFALHQLEMLTGRLKMVIPAGIAATDEPELRTALDTLLDLL